MRQITKAFLFIILFTALMSCKKSEDTVTYPVENFSTEFLSITGFNEELNLTIDSSDYEFGIEFTPTQTGVMTSVEVQIPDVNNALRITIWDKASQTPIRTETVDVAVADTVYSFDIDELNLVKDVEYMITMNSNDWNVRSRTDANTVTYPIAIGNITVINYGYVFGTSQEYPTNFYNNYYAGDLFFSFQQTE